MKTFIIRPSKFLSVMMIIGGASLLYAMDVIPKGTDASADVFFTVVQLNAIAVMLFGLVNLVRPKGIATERIDEQVSSEKRSATTESFAALQQLYDKGLLTHEEYRHKVDFLTRADTSSKLNK